MLVWLNLLGILKIAELPHVITELHCEGVESAPCSIVIYTYLIDNIALDGKASMTLMRKNLIRFIVHTFHSFNL